MLLEILPKIEAAGARLAVVSKNQPLEKIQKIYEHGQRLFAENRVQALLERRAALPADIEWHLIGHLQTNKVRAVAPFVSMIHSVDSLRLLSEIEKEAKRCGRTIDCLLQFHIAEEETKFGLDEQEAVALLQSADFQKISHAKICGVMGMATFTDDKNQVRQEFRNLRRIFQKLKNEHFLDRPEFREISMGMSDDWEIALEEGATLLRIGSLIFN